MKKARNGRYAPPSARRDQVTGPRPHIRRAKAPSGHAEVKSLEGKDGRRVGQPSARPGHAHPIRASVFDAATAFRARLEQAAHGEAELEAHLRLPFARRQPSPSPFARSFPSRQASPPFAGRLTATRVFLKSHLSPRAGPGADAAPTARPDAGCRASASLQKLLHGRRFVNPFRLLPCCNHARKACDFIRN